MSNHTTYIPLSGIGEIEFDVRKKILSKSNKNKKVRKLPSIGKRHFENSNSTKWFFYWDKKLKW